MKRVLVAVALATMASTARAQLAVRGQDSVVYKRHTSLVFTTTELKGRRLENTVDGIWLLGRPTFKSLIRLRTSFGPELQGTAAKL